MSIEVMKMALEALELYQAKSSVQMFDDAAKFLRQAIKQAEQQEGTVMAEYKFQTYAVYKKDGETKIGVMPEPEQEPVAWRDMAYANLGAVRDKMPPGQVTAVQDWLEKVYTTPPQRKPLTEWQPIETAPKTGRKVILFYLNRNKLPRTVMARWLSDEQAAETDADDVGLEGGWYECIDNWDDYTEVAIHEGEPSHWMPLPAPPIEAAHGIGEKA